MCLNFFLGDIRSQRTICLTQCSVSQRRVRPCSELDIFGLSKIYFSDSAQCPSMRNQFFREYLRFMKKCQKISGHCHFKLINTVRSFSAALSLALKGVFSKNRLVGKLYMEAKVNFFIHILLR